MGDGKQADAAHFVFRFFAPGYADGRAGRVVRIIGRVVPVDFGVEARAFGQGDEIFEVINILPGKVPIVREVWRSFSIGSRCSGRVS